MREIEHKKLKQEEPAHAYIKSGWSDWRLLRLSMDSFGTYRVAVLGAETKHRQSLGSLRGDLWQRFSTSDSGTL